MSETKTVTVGADTYSIAPFSGFKAVRIGRLVAEIGKQVPTLIDDMGATTRRIERDNVVRITRSMSVLPKFKPLFDEMAMSEEDWQNCGGVVEIPQPADPNLVFAAVFPQIFDKAEASVLDLLAWVASTNKELEDADENDAVDAHIKQLQKTLLHKGKLDELAQLALVGWSVVGEQLKGQAQELGKAITGLMGRRDDSQSSGETPAPEAPVNEEASTTRQSLSTDSDTPTGGPDVKPSTETASVS